MTENPTMNIDVGDKITGVNSFWLASLYGNGGCMKILAEKGIDILNFNNQTGNNALHIAVSKNYINIVKMLIQSKFPLDIPIRDGITALGLAC